MSRKSTPRTVSSPPKYTGLGKFPVRTLPNSRVAKTLRRVSGKYLRASSWNVCVRAPDSSRSGAYSADRR